MLPDFLSLSMLGNHCSKTQILETGSPSALETVMLIMRNASVIGIVTEIVTVEAISDDAVMPTKILLVVADRFRYLVFMHDVTHFSALRNVTRLMGSDGVTPGPGTNPYLAWQSCSISLSHALSPNLLGDDYRTLSHAMAVQLSCGRPAMHNCFLPQGTSLE